MGNRSLAHIEKVISIHPIMCEGKPADNIELVQILDYYVVAQKGECQVGKLVLYVEVDAILPECKEFEFLRSKKFTIKAMKFGAKFTDANGNRIISQGIIFDIGVLHPEIELIEGADLTEQLNITKVIEDAEEDVSLNDKKKLSFMDKLNKKLMRYPFYRRLKKNIFGEKIKGTWADWMPSKSDEVNIQMIFSRLKAKYGDDNGWYVTEKLEGRNLSIYIYRTKSLFGKKTNIGVCTHTRNLITDDGSAFWKTAKKSGIIEKLAQLDKDYFVRGEHVGLGIQKNIYGFPETDFYVFDVWDIEEQRKLNYAELVEFCRINVIKMVPILDNNFALPETVQDLLNYSNGISVFGKNVMREGVVIRRKDDPNISFKDKSPEYLAKDKKKK